MDIEIPEARRLEALRLAKELVSHTSGDPREVLNAARLFLAFLEGDTEPKTDAKLKVVS